MLTISFRKALSLGACIVPLLIGLVATDVLRAQTSPLANGQIGTVLPRIDRGRIVSPGGFLASQGEVQVSQTVSPLRVRPGGGFVVDVLIGNSASGDITDGVASADLIGDAVFIPQLSTPGCQQAEQVQCTGIQVPSGGFANVRLTYQVSPTISETELTHEAGLSTATESFQAPPLTIPVNLDDCAIFASFEEGQVKLQHTLQNSALRTWTVFIYASEQWAPLWSAPIPAYPDSISFPTNFPFTETGLFLFASVLTNDQGLTTCAAWDPVLIQQP